jgi:hypothetical protein
MSWRSKFLFMLIIYFAGFATAVYHLAPSGANGQQSDNYSYTSDEKSGNANSAFDKFCDKAREKAYAGFSGMDSKDFKAYFNRGLQAIKDMARSSQTNTEGGEDK